MSRARRTALVLGAAMAAVVAGFLVANSNRQEPASQAGTSSDAAKLATSQLLAKTLPDPNGSEQALSQWTGKILVVNFWATWCPPCRDEMPGFSQLQTRYAANGVQFVGIAFDSADKVKEFSGLTPVSYPLLIGSSELMPIAGALGDSIGALPFTVIIGRDGALRQTHLGIWKETALQAVLVDLLK